MVPNLHTLIKTNVVRIGAAFCAGVVLVLGAVALLQPFPAQAPTAPEKVTSIATSTVLTLPESEPLQISIPSLSLTAEFEAPLYLEENNEIEVPEAYTTVAYYGYGPTPGEVGPAVVLGHVDSYEGPAVFYDLGQLTPGDEVLITRKDGTTAVFTVTRLERHPQSGFPTEEVYGDLDHAGLRLITCTGTFDHGIQRYSHNLIVFAELTGTASSSAQAAE